MSCYTCSIAPGRNATPLRQLPLAKPADAESTLLRPDSEDVSLFRLPHELLEEIFNLAMGDYQWSPSTWAWQSQHYATALDLSYVCKRFHFVVRPLLYRHIEDRGHELIPPCKSMINLLRTLEANPELGTFCRSLSFHGPQTEYPPPLSDHDVAYELLNYFPQTTAFELDSGGGHGRQGFGFIEGWPLVYDTLGKMPQLKRLSLGPDHRFGFNLAAICNAAQRMHLQSLTLRGTFIAENEDNTPGAKELERTSTITKLELNEFFRLGTFGALEMLLDLPRALKHFHCGLKGRKYRKDLSWDLDTLSRALRTRGHQVSLESILVGPAPKPENAAITFLDFLELKTLHLSRWSFDFSPEFNGATLLAPKLHTFVWDFTIPEKEFWESLKQEQMDQILRFASIATAQKSSLRLIKIMIDPHLTQRHCGPTTVEETEEWLNPWKLLGQTKDKLKPNGIELSYTEPFWTREKCLKSIVQFEREQSLQKTY